MDTDEGEMKEWPEIVQGNCELSHPHRRSFSAQIRNSAPSQKHFIRSQLINREVAQGDAM